MAKDPYTVLGVQRGATDAEIQKAFRRLAKKSHPDLFPGDKKAEDRFKELNAANDILGDSAKRARFDRGEIDGSGAEVRQNPFAGAGRGHRRGGGPRGVAAAGHRASGTAGEPWGAGGRGGDRGAVGGCGVCRLKKGFWFVFLPRVIKRWRERGDEGEKERDEVMRGEREKKIALGLFER